MKTRTLVTSLFAAALVATPMALYAQGQGQGQGRSGDEARQRAQVERGQRDFDRGRMTDRARSGMQQHDRDRIKDRTKAPETAPQSENAIYGAELMTEAERNQYRKKLGEAKTPEEREQLMEQHRHEMRVRAEEQGVTVRERTRTKETEESE